MSKSWKCWKCGGEEFEEFEIAMALKIVRCAKCYWNPPLFMAHELRKKRGEEDGS